jgi:hypothetical protein
VKALILAGTIGAGVGGALRIMSSFIPYVAEVAWLEGLYAAIDIGLLLGLLAVYLSVSTGAGGAIAFLVAFAALASLVGPDARAFGVDFYRLGASVFSLALAAFALTLLAARAFRTAAILWLASAVAGVAAASSAPLAFQIAGMMLGAGFIAAASALIAQQRKQAPA